MTDEPKPEPEESKVGGPNDGASPPPDPFKSGLDLAVLLHLHFEQIVRVLEDKLKGVLVAVADRPPVELERQRLAIKLLALVQNERLDRAVGEPLGLRPQRVRRLGDEPQIDITWDEPEDRTYVGVRIPFDTLVAILTAQDVHGVLASDWLNGNRIMKSGVIEAPTTEES